MINLDIYKCFTLEKVERRLAAILIIIERYTKYWSGSDWKHHFLITR